MTYQALLDEVVKLRSSPQVEDRPDVPATLPVGKAVGRELLIPLPGRTIRVLMHVPSAGSERRPVYFNLHGGGMVKGSPEMDEFLCAQVCSDLGCAVVNVDYRLAPEHPFPHGLQDCYEVIAYLAEHAEEYAVDPNKMAVGGQSAGGNLAAATAIMANRKQEFSLKGQVLVYAGLRFDGTSREATDAIPEDVIPKSTAGLYQECYGFGGADLSDPLASPINAGPADLRGLPPALIMTAELDTLTIDAEEYASHLLRAGCFVQAKRFLGCVHGFTHRGYETEPGIAIQMIIDFLDRCFA